ncbi:MAG: hypothetical protein ACOZBW_10435, partial [Thermodesulfobacteriota bacterium]
ENFSRATVPADDFYWGDLNGFPPVRTAGFVVASLRETEYTLSFPNIYTTTTGYEDVPSQMRIPGEFDTGKATYGSTPHRTNFASQPMFPWFYDPTEVTDVALLHYPPAGKKQFADHDWGALLSWIDHTGDAPIMWNGHLLVPADTAFFAAAHSTIEISTPRLCLTVSTTQGLADSPRNPDFELARQMDHILGTLCIEDLSVRLEGGVMDQAGTVQKVIVVYPNL